MTTVDVPQPRLLALPTLQDVWRAVNHDRAVAITALVCATVVAVALIVGLVLVVTGGGDVTAVALAMGTVLSAVAVAWGRVRAAAKAGDRE